MIRICFVQSFGYSVFNPDSDARIGGAEVDLYNISTELAKDTNFKVFFLTGDFGQKNVELHKDVVIVKTYPYKKSIRNYLTAFLKFFRKLIDLNADVYVTAGYTKEIGLVGIYCKLFRKVHIHRTEHDSEFKKQNLILRIKGRKITGFLFYIGFLLVDSFVVQNKEHQNQLFKNFNISSLVIRNSYRIPLLKNFKREFILWIARGEKWKRPEIFLKLVENFPDENFIMIMPKGSDSIFFEEITSKTKLLPNLKFIPGVSFSQVDYYYQHAKVFVNTSESEGFPNSFNQAMNYSTPLLSLNISPDDFIQKNNVGLYCNNDFNQLKDNLNRLLSDAKLWEEKSQSAYKFVMKFMNIENSIKDWKKLISNLHKNR